MEKNINDMPYGIAKVIELLYAEKLEEALQLLSAEVKRKSKPTGATVEAPKKKRGRRSKAEIEAAKAVEKANGHDKEEAPKASVASETAKAAKASKAKKKEETPAEEDPLLAGFDDALNEIEFE